jgi:hypothetical protein
MMVIIILIGSINVIGLVCQTCEHISISNIVFNVSERSKENQYGHHFIGCIARSGYKTAITSIKSSYALFS